MADKDKGTGDGPSLELPSFGLGRKKRPKRGTPPAATEGESTADADSGSVEPTLPLEEEPVERTRPVEEPAAAEPTDPPESPMPPPVDPEPGPAPEAAPAPDAEPMPEPEPEPEQREPRPPMRERFAAALPDVGGRVAAVITGLVIGVLAVGATYLSLRLCSLIKGTSSCGGPGLLLLVAVLIVLVFLGSALLRGFGQPDPASTSFLAVGLLAVIALLFLVEVIFSPVMIVVIPVVSTLTYLLSHWVTTTFIQPARDD